MLRTTDGGRTWQDVSPPGSEGLLFRDVEARSAWHASVMSIGNGDASRIYTTRDGGSTWTVSAAPIPAAPAGGVFSLAFRNPRHGVMVGGDFMAEANGVDASGFTRDGDTWHPGGDLSGYRSGVDWVPFSRATLIAVGPNGSDVSHDGGRSWTAFDSAHYDAVDCVPFTCWASGPEGAVAVLARR